MVGHGLTRAGLWRPGGAWSLMYRDAGSCTHIRAHMSRRVDICAQKRTYRCLGQLRTIHTPSHPHTPPHIHPCHDMPPRTRMCAHVRTRDTRCSRATLGVCTRARTGDVWFVHALRCEQRIWAGAYRTYLDDLPHFCTNICTKVSALPHCAPIVPLPPPSRLWPGGLTC